MICVCNDSNLSELESLKIQAAAIQKRIYELSAPVTIANRCKRRPLSLPKLENGDSRNQAIYNPKWLDQDVWKCFLTLGKMIHAKNGTFVARGGNWRSDPYFADEVKPFVPVKISQLTNEEADVSAEMIDKLVEIYNEYMVKLHPTVNVIDVDGVCHTVAVKPPEDMEE